MRHTGKRTIALFLCLLLLLTLFACKESAKTESKKPVDEVAKETPSEKAEDHKEGKEESGKKDSLVLTVGPRFDSGKFDPKQKFGSHSQHRMTHQSLLKYNTELELIGDLADRYEISKDGLSWSIFLKKGMKFSNGEEVTVDDVLFTYQMLKEDGVAFDLSFVKSMEKKGDDGLVFHLESPRITFVSQLTEIPIVPKNHYDENYTNQPIGSGPYVVKEYKVGEQVIFEANPYYHKELNFKKITVLLLEEDAGLAAAKAGGVDIVAVPPAFSNQKIKDMTLQSFDSIDVRGMTLPTLPAGHKGKINDVEVEVGNDITSDLAIRQALHLGINRQELIDLAMNGHGKIAHSLCDETPWFNEKQVVKDGDIEKAKKILKDAGWEDTDGDGILEKDGKKASFDLYYNAADKLRGDLSIGLADQAIKIGIEIIPRGSSWDEIYRVGKANAVLWGGGRHHPHQLYSMYTSKLWDVGYNNMSQFKDEKVDEYLEKAMTSSSLEEANKNWKLAQLDEDGKTGVAGIAQAPILWLTRIDHLYFIHNKVDVGKQILHPHGHEWGLFNDIETWKVKE